MALLAVVAVVSSGATSALFAERPEESWNRRIQETVAALRAGETEKARGTIDGVLKEMAGRANPGKSAHKGIGMGLMLRALTEAQRSDERLATWDWHLAQQFDPALESWPLDEFGAAGEMLSRHRISTDPPPPTESAEELLRRGVTRIEVVKRGVWPEDIARARARRWQGSLRVNAVVQADGKATHPRIQTETDEAGLMFQLCESLRTSEFEPARLDSQAIPMTYEMGFRLTLE